MNSNSGILDRPPPFNLDAEKGVVGSIIPTTRLLQTARANLDRAGESGGGLDYQSMTCAELMVTEYEIRFWVERILVAGQPCILAGPKKALKTSLLLDLAIALTMGGFFLGKFKVPAAATVGLMTGESGMPTIQETIQRICRQAGYDPAGITNLIVTDQVPQLASIKHLDAVRALIMEYALDVLMVDPVYMTMSGADAGNLFVQGGLLRGISQVCQDNGVTLILCHHTKKGVQNPFGVPELDNIAWAGFAEFARQWMLVGRREPYAPGTGEHRLWLTVGGSVGHSGLWGLDVSEGIYDEGRHWQVDVLDGDEIRQSDGDRKEAAKDEKKRKELETHKKTLVEAMVQLSEPDSKNGIRDVVGLGHGTKFERAWAPLFADGSIVRAGTVKKGNGQNYDAFKLSDSETDL